LLQLLNLILKQCFSSLKYSLPSQWLTTVEQLSPSLTSRPEANSLALIEASSFILYPSLVGVVFLLFGKVLDSSHEAPSFLAGLSIQHNAMRL